MYSGSQFQDLTQKQNQVAIITQITDIVRLPRGNRKKVDAVHEIVTT